MHALPALAAQCHLWLAVLARFQASQGLLSDVRRYAQLGCLPAVFLRRTRRLAQFVREQNCEGIAIWALIRPALA